MADKTKSLKKNYITKKVILIAAHVIGVLLLAFGVVAIYGNPNFQRGIISLNEEAYEETDSFIRHFNEDINFVFDYINTKDVFETNGEFDLKKPIFSISEGPMVDTEYTVEDVIATAKRRGYYLNEEYKIVSSPDIISSADADTSYIVNWKNYKSKSEPMAPTDSYMTIDELIVEVLDMLSCYYKAYNTLILRPTNFAFHIEYGKNAFFNNKALSAQNAPQLGKYAIVDKDNLQVQTNVANLPTDLQYLAANCEYNTGEHYSAVVAVDTSFKVDDVYAQESYEYTTQRRMYFIELMIIILGGVLTLISLIMLVAINLKHREDFRFNRLPHSDASFEGRIFACALTIIVLLFLNERVFSRFFNIYVPQQYVQPAIKASGYAIIYGCIIVTAFSILRSYLADDIWSKSLTKQLYDRADRYFDETTFSKRFTWIFVAYVLANALLVGIFVALIARETTLVQRFIAIAIILVFVAGNIVVLLAAQKRMSDIDKIDVAVRNIASGDTGYQLNLEEFSGNERRIAENLNNIGAGLDAALSEKMKSERLKTDLITNVSHDIKTPLTSIINYIDLIKRENPSEPRIVEYLQILEQKSQHLKNLTEDLVEASKVQSGNISLDMQVIDFNEMVMQANGEFEEKFATRKLTIVSKLPKQPVLIMADGRSLWRVLENIYNNAFKYAAEGTRIYVDIEENPGKDTNSGGTATFTMKNISSNPLNINADELTERFVRGDVARSTEGSGLGLSIAESLARMQGGKFSIAIDGDLFKAMVKFALYEKKENV